MTTPTAQDRARARVGGSAITAAIIAMNLSTYAFTIAAARILGPQPFGALTAVMNVLLVAGVLTLALQATAARRIAQEPEHRAEIEDQILRVGRRSAAGVGLLFLVLAPVFDRALRLGDLPTALLIAAAVIPTTMMGAQAGVLQGERRWIPLALVYLGAGLSRLAVGLTFLWWQPTETAAVAAVALSAWVPVLIGGYALRRRERAGSAADSVLGSPSGHTASALWWETVHNSQALLAFLAVGSLDIVIARNAFDARTAGLYAGGLIMVKAVTFLPQFVVVLAFPSMGTSTASRRVLIGSLAGVGLLGLLVAAGAVVLSGLALVFVGGAEYRAIQDDLWIFALIGTLLSMVQLLVYGVLARQDRITVALIWIAVVGLVAWGLSSTTLTELAWRVLSVDALLFLALLAVSLRPGEHQD